MADAEPPADHSQHTTWGGKPIEPDPPTGATVMVWRAGADGELELLLLHRAHRGPDYDGDWAWTPPAGARFPDEPVDMCAARELYEEAGLALPVVRIDAGETWARYVAEAPADAVVMLHDPEHDRFEWVGVAESLRRVSPDTVREGLRSTVARRTRRGPPRVRRRAVTDTRRPCRGSTRAQADCPG